MEIWGKEIVLLIGYYDEIFEPINQQVVLVMGKSKRKTTEIKTREERLNRFESSYLYEIVTSEERENAIQEILEQEDMFEYMYKMKKYETAQGIKKENLEYYPEWDSVVENAYRKRNDLEYYPEFDSVEVVRRLRRKMALEEKLIILIQRRSKYEYYYI